MEEINVSRECMLKFVRTRMLYKQAIQRMLKREQAGITFEMLQVLACLWKEQGISQQVIAERTAKDKACLSSLMNNLEKKGYIYRRENCEDRRHKLVYSTEEGEKFRKWIQPRIKEFYRLLDEEIGIGHIKETISSLNKWCDVLEKF